MTGTDAPPSRPRLLLAPAATAVAAAAGAWALHLRDPHVGGSWGWCPFLLATGQPCPGCGALRAVHHLTDGDVVAALGSNALVVLAAPLLLTLWVRWSARRAAGRDDAASAAPIPVLAVVCVVVVVFAVVRLLPIGAPLGP